MTYSVTGEKQSVNGSKEPGTQPVAGGFDGWLLSFCREQVLNLLAQMRCGQLSLTLPNGETKTFGNTNLAGAEKESVSAEIVIRNDEFFKRVVMFGDIGLSEAYLEGLWETPSIRAVISWFLLNIEGSPVLNESSAQAKLFNALGTLNKLIHSARSNNIKNSKSNIQAHYDLGNQFFKIFLDESMTYSSALLEAHESAGNLDLHKAQMAKIDRLCRKLRLQPSDHVLEIGCGWGAFSIHAARKYGCRITGITISQEQFKHTTELVKREGLDKLIDIQLIDYRLVKGSFDKIASIEMIEAVGDEHMDTFFACCNRLLKHDGLLGMQMISSPDSRYEILKKNVDFIQKHIFPGSLLPSLRRINEAMERSGDLFLYDLFDMGRSYVETLKQWEINFNQSIDQVKELGFDEQFIRKWNYYFEYCQAAFDMRNITVVQAIYTRPNNLNLRT